jgi:valyl-tRNA synthetase
MADELSKVYEAKSIEPGWYKSWLDKGLFKAVSRRDKKPYTIVIPPPNITGILTMGHVLNNTLQDILVRWKRMSGYEACWVPGTDHAGIATQHVVEKELAGQNISRHDLGREKFVERVWQWKEKYGSTIIRQLKALGCSCDWSKERFTLDDGLSNAVREVFIRLHQKGLIYRGKYIVNWCPKCTTALSDDEVDHREHEGCLWYIKYPVQGGGARVVVATTRPETMLGDTAVAVNPGDERYRDLKGRKVMLPLVGREIPVIEDAFVDPQFGTGIVKVTPAHDPNDFQMGLRHKLEQVITMDERAKMNGNVPEVYRGLDRYKCRERVVEDLTQQGLIEKTEKHANAVGHCYRCGTVIEPYLSDQWFVRMKPLAEGALKAVQDGRIKFYPERWTKVYENWIDNIRDWCISRQLWWGHRIPVWYCEAEGGKGGKCPPIVQKETPAKCPCCGSADLRQDSDVLDTWFSSWLRPFSTLGWPEETADLKYFYPTSALVTAPDIIFFWVARMVMAGLEFMKDIPFSEVYFTSTVRDMQGRKMSKSLGNSPDPLDLINEYGADSLRFTVAYLSPMGQDILFSGEKCEIGRKFCNKIWNTARFAMMNLEGFRYDEKIDSRPGDLDRINKWILSEYNRTVEKATKALERLDFVEYSHELYDSFWSRFCDWYLELSKPLLAGDGRAGVQHTLLSVLTGYLKLMHPVMPFISEELYQLIKKAVPGHPLLGSDSIVVAPWPVYDGTRVYPGESAEVEFAMVLIREIRTIRTDMNVPVKQMVEIMVNTESKEIMENIDRFMPNLRLMAKVEKASRVKEKPKHCAVAVVGGAEVYIMLEGIIDLQKEEARLKANRDKLLELSKSQEKKLGNEQFLAHAPASEVERVKAANREALEKLGRIEKYMEMLK